jgi:hypothetical protein
VERIAKIVGARADGRRRALTFAEKPPRAAARVETPSAAYADDIALARELCSMEAEGAVRDGACREARAFSRSTLKRRLEIRALRTVG